MSPKNTSDYIRRVWNLDKATLDLAWLLYTDIPTAERRGGFGKFFLNHFYIPGIIEWPALEDQEDDGMAYEMLHEFCC